MNDHYINKFRNFDKNKFHLLGIDQQQYLETVAFQYLFTFQEFNIVTNIFLDLEQWGENCSVFFKEKEIERKESYLSELKNFYEGLKQNKSYEDFEGRDYALRAPYKVSRVDNKSAKILGTCPVFSERTLCCNLETIDSFRNCSYGCSYCSIQSYFDKNEVLVDRDFVNKLNALEIDDDKIYHFGTGQSSDSLLWGNKEGHLEALLDFARRNPNVILELKTKSSNVDFLESLDIPKNVITTWSLNPEVIIKNEEHRTASLEERLRAAKKISAKGNLVGFHFHPIIFYDGFEKDYRDLVQKIVGHFTPEECALVSLGTVTFNKKTINEIRKKKRKWPGNIRIQMKPRNDCFQLSIKHSRFGMEKSFSTYVWSLMSFGIAFSAVDI